MPSLVNGLYEFAEFRLDARKRTLRQGEESIALTPKAFDTLLVLLENPGQVVAKDELMKAVWPASFVEESNLTQTIYMLRKALKETSEQRYILTVPGVGYRFIGELQAADGNGAAPSEAPSELSIGDLETREESGTSLPSRRWPVLVGALVLVVAVASFFLVRVRSRSQAEAPGSRALLAVLPFENLTGDPSQEYVSDGLTEEMIGQMGKLDPQRLGVIASTSVMHYKGGKTPLQQIGHDLGVQYVMEGSVRRDAQRLRINAQLIQMKDQSQVWARQYDRELSDLLSVEQAIAQEIAGEIQPVLRNQTGNTAVHYRAESAATSPETYDLYLKGIYFWNQRTLDGFQRAADYFQQAIAKSPNYGRAYAGLAITRAVMGNWKMGPQNELMPKARADALKALQLDDRLAEAHATLGLVAEVYDYDWRTAENEFRRAIELDPGYATAHQWYGEYLSWQGRFDEALAESERARQLDPLSMIIAIDHGSILHRARQYDRAIAQYRAVLEMDPANAHTCGLLAEEYVAARHFSEATDLITNCIFPRSKEHAWGLQSIVYAGSGRTEMARQTFAKFETYERKLDPTSPVLVVGYIASKQNDQAIALLQKAFAEHSGVITNLKVEPFYDPLRSDPRFQELLERAGFGSVGNPPGDIVRTTSGEVP
jgi:TolB-like protein/DNA-binding winged helix-turn-helix (wHTH) protein